MGNSDTILDRFRLDGKVAVVTGASRGLGAAIAEALTQAGADLVVAGRDLQRLGPIRIYSERLGRRCLPVVCDVEDFTQIHALIETAAAQLGHIDILVNAAGTTHRDHPEDFPESQWERVLRVNLDAVFVACQQAGRHMIAQRRGKIINIASMLSFTGGILVPAYAASKAGVALLTKALANEWARHNIQVNAIAPGYFRTEMTQPLYDDPIRHREVLSRIPAGRWGEPPDLKGAAVFLASAASDYVNGHILAVDGGWLAR